ncbi:MAG: Fe-S protein assembly co-chaperone HscB [Polyangiaceae bacterium]|jgi:molecular chaperone HscB|nr:Fe-S protein assembly co-chaperone HscB [Polyangiaceae bacterium]
MDPFETLGIEPRFDLDMRMIEKRHRELSRALHPDRYVGRPASERRMALNRAIEVNQAWRVVRDPVRRAEALLRRAGLDAGETGGATADPGLLMEMMEQREALGEARMERDAAKVQRLTDAMRDRERRVLGSLAARLDSHDAESIASALPALGELRFVRRFLEEASAAEDELL